MIGCYVQAYELGGRDRANYGERLLAELSRELAKQKVANTGKRQLYNYRSFYRTYPQIVRTVSAQFPTLAPAALRQAEKVPTASAQFELSPDQLLQNLSYSHFELLTAIEDPTQRAFYESQCVSGRWSVRELKRQIASLLYERTGILLCTEKNHALVEYALAGMDNQLFVSKYQLALPDKEDVRRFVEAQIAGGLGLSVQPKEDGEP